MPRDSNGNYTLPSSVNPVVSDTTITSLWANTTLADVAQGVSDSLDRYGRGGMLAPFKIADGSVGAPGLSFSNEASTGFWRKSAGVVALSILGTETFDFSAAGIGMPAGVANGVAYFNGADVLTSGSVFQFTSSTDSRLSVSAPAGTGASYLDLINASNLVVGIENSVGGDLIAGSSPYYGVIANGGAYGLHFGVSDAIAASLNAAGNLGLGMLPSAWESGAKVLQLSTSGAGGTAGSAGSIWARGDSLRLIENAVYTGSQYTYLANGGAAAFSILNGYFQWQTAVAGAAGSAASLALQMTLNNAGNLGIGPNLATPSPWSLGRAIEVGYAGNAVWGYQQGNLYLTSNVYYNGGWVYASTGAIAYYNINSGAHSWGSAPSGTVGSSATLSPFLVLDVYGRLYGTALHNNPQPPSGAINQYIASGTYSPVITNVSNISGSGVVYGANWVRVGNVVTVKGSVGFNVAVSNTSTSATVSLPLALSGNFANANQAIGLAVATYTASVAANVGSVAGTQTVSLQFQSNASGATVVEFDFSYVVF